jgi:hypothetical protein
MYVPLGNSLMSEDSKFLLGKSAFLILKPNAKRLVLLDSKEQVLDARFLLLNEKVCSGTSLDMQVFSVLIGERISSDSIDHGIKLLNSDNGEFPSLRKDHNSSAEVVAPNMHRSFAQVVSSVSHAHDAPGTSLPVAFDFAKGLAFSKEVHSKFGHHANCLPNRARNFFLGYFFWESLF